MAFRRQRTVVLLAAVLALSALALSACGESAGGGGDSGGGDAQALLDRAFTQPVDSADIDIDAQIEIDGLEGFEEPLRIEATGPYVRSKDTLPKLDLDIGLDARGAGQTIQSGLLSTGDRVFLEFGGDFYEQPPEQVARNNRQLARGSEGGGSLSDLGLNPSEWVVDASVEGEEQIDGVATDHVSGTLDVEALVDDLNGLVKRSAGPLGAGDSAQPLRKGDIERLSKTVEDPSFDVYVGKDDDVVRRLSLRIDVSVPDDDRNDVGGITGASIRLSAELHDVGGDQKVEPPSDSRPLSDLTSQLGSLSSIAGDALGGGGGTGATPTPDSTGDSRTDGSTPDGAGADVFERYGECLERAQPDDAEAITRCAELVR